MQKYNGTLLRKFDDPVQGNASVGTSVVVRKKSDNSIAPIYSVDDINSIQKPNPFTTDSFGRYSFFAPNGKYLLQFGDGSDEIEISMGDNLDHSGLANRNAVGAHEAEAINNANGGSLQYFINGIYPPLLPSSTDTRHVYNKNKSALRMGTRDISPLDDPLSYWRGLIDKDTWNDEAYYGVGSASFGRNGAAYAYLSTTFGHDCIAYGAAATVGGAGSCAGNPDDPNNNADWGYCSLAHGKYAIAKGRISFSLGEETQSNSLNSMATGWKTIAGPCVAGMPNPIGAGPVISDGRGAHAMGYYAEAYGDGSFSLGHYIKSYNGAMTFGYGINSGSPIVNAIPGAVGIAANSDVMALQVTPANGTNGGFSRVGQNTTFPNERYESMLKNTDKIAYRLDEGEAGATLSLQRTVGGVISDVVAITFNNAGVGAIIINGQQVVSNRAAAISNAQTDSNKIQAILDTLRYHGLIAP